MKASPSQDIGTVRQLQAEAVFKDMRRLVEHKMSCAPQRYGDGGAVWLLHIGPLVGMAQLTACSSRHTEREDKTRELAYEFEFGERQDVY